MMEKAAEQQAAADIGSFQVVFKIPGRVSLGASEGAKGLLVRGDECARSGSTLRARERSDRISRSEL